MTSTFDAPTPGVVLVLVGGIAAVIAVVAFVTGDEPGLWVGPVFGFLALILIYVAIMASKLVRIARDLAEVADLVERRDRERAEAPAEETVPR